MKIFFLILCGYALSLEAARFNLQGITDQLNIDFSFGPSKKEEKKSYPKISQIHRGFHATRIVLDNKNTFIVSTFEVKNMQHWMDGQRIEVGSDQKDFLHPIILNNIDACNAVHAKRPSFVDDHMATF